MNDPYDVTMAFMAGLLGSGHCVGMCGSLVSAFFLRCTPAGHLSHLAYHGGRLGVYGLIGVLAATLGVALTATGAVGKVQGILQILAGGVVILLGLDLLGFLRLRYDFWPLSRLRRLFVLAGERGPIQGALVGGMINGFMPCSLTLAVAVHATTAGDPWSGGALMLAFGLGTLPAMLFVSTAFSRLGATVRGHLLKVAALCVIVLGVGTLWQGVKYFAVMRQLADG